MNIDGKLVWIVTIYFFLYKFFLKKIFKCIIMISNGLFRTSPFLGEFFFQTKKKYTLDSILCHIHLSIMSKNILDYRYILWCISWGDLMHFGNSIRFFKIPIYIKFELDFKNIVMNFVLCVFWCLKRLLMWIPFYHLHIN